MFEVKEIDGEELVKSILACQMNDNPEVEVITARGLMLSELPPKIPLKQEKEWVPTGKISPNAWRLEMEDDFSFFIPPKKKR